MSSRKIIMSVSGIYAYATLKDDAVISPDDLRKELKAIVRQKIGSFAVPEVIQVKFVSQQVVSNLASSLMFPCSD